MKCNSKKCPVFSDDQTQPQVEKLTLWSRRYIGCKTRLLDWIFDIIEHNTTNVRSFCDLFAGTGVVAQRALTKYERVFINDFLSSNHLIYKAFFADEEWNELRVQRLLDAFNAVPSSRLKPNYFSRNYGGKYFDEGTAKQIGYIRERLTSLRTHVTAKEYAVLMASLIYSMDRIANTLGHFDAYIKKEIAPRPFLLRMVDAQKFRGAEIFQEDANRLAKHIHADLTYIDPPYNSRQYSRFYHVYENLVEWKKPALFGAAMKPKEGLMSDYCKTAALHAFTDLVAHVDSRFLVVSYNNTYHSKSSSSSNKILLEDLESVLRQCGETRVFSRQFRPFTSGKTEFDDHKEYLFVTEVDNERRNRAFAALLCR